MENKSKKIKISIIEDSKIHREWLRAELSEIKTYEIVSIDQFGRKGIESVKNYQSDLALIDFQMEDMTGLEVSKRLKTYNECIKIFIITAHAEISIIERIIKDKNIDGIAIKGSYYFEDNFLRAIRSVVNGGSYIDPSLLGKLRDSKNAKGLSQLTRREFEIFIQISTGKLDEKIAEDLCVEPAHVKNMKSKIMKKIKNDDLDYVLMKLLENTNPDYMKSLGSE
jgi:DNA-binding NarL/FixJ family response regulator